MNLSLIIPDLLLPQAPNALLDRYQDLRLPALERLLARGTPHRSLGCTLESFLLKQFKVEGNDSVTPYTWLADGGSTDESYWLRADPVYLQAQRGQLVLVDGAMLDITEAEADALCTTLNQHFVSDNLRFFPAHPARWYLALDRAPEISTVPLAQVAGQSVNDCLPRGNASQRWNQILNEAQMLLHTHPINTAREQRGQALINSLWLWGGGVAQALPPCSLQHIWANDALARGLALTVKVPCHALPQDAAACLANATPDAKQWVVLDGLRRAAWYGDDEAWRAGLAQMETHWFAPLEQALHAGRIRSLSLYAMNAQGLLTLHSKRVQCWYFWRRPKALTHYLSS